MLEKTLIFLHIPRTAGNSLNQVAVRQFPANSVYQLHWQRSEESLRRLEGITDEKKRELKFIMGHMGFGAHRYLRQNSTYFTMLRDPVERLISHYYSAVMRPIHYLHGTIKPKTVSLAEYIKSGITTETDNEQVRLVSGMEWEAPDFGKCTGEMLEKAKDNLKKHFPVIGLTERFDETLVLLKRRLGWRRLFYISVGVDTHYCPKKEDLPEDTLGVIQEHNKLDMELYKFAKSMFEEETRKEGISFFIEVRLFRIANAVYGGHFKTRRLFYRVRKNILQKSKELAKNGLQLFGIEIRLKKNLLEKALSRNLKPRTVIDIGAREGTPELYRAFPDAKHILIEPHDRYIPYLARWASCLKDAKYVVGPASNVSGKAAYGYDDISHPDGKLAYSTVTVDEICRENNTKGPYLLKISTNGRELGILEGASDTLKNTTLAIFMPSFARVSYEKFMSEHGFSLIRGASKQKIQVWQKIEPGKCIKVKDWIAASGSQYGATYKEIYPKSTIPLRLPKTIEKEIHWTYLDESGERPAAFAAEIPKGRLWANGYSTDAAVITPDNKMLSDISFQAGRPAEANLVFKETPMPPLYRVKGTSADLTAMASGYVYFHWMFDVLPRIHLLQKSGLFKEIDYFIVNQNTYPFQKETLTHLGISEKMIIESVKHPYIEAERLIAASPLGAGNNMPGWACDFLRAAFLPDHPPRGGAARKRIYISRNDSGSRRVINEEEVFAFLKGFGFEKYILSGMPVREQAELFASCEAVITVQGAALTNIVFCQANAKVMEIYLPTFIEAWHWFIACHLGLDFYYLIGKGERSLSKDKWHLRNKRADVLVDIDDLRKTLELAGIGTVKKI